MENLKLGVIGCGYMAQSAHLPCLAAIPGVSLESVYDPRKNVAEKVAARFGIASVADDVESLLKNVDAVLVLTQAQWHFSNIKKALKAGRHVFTEKPLAMCVNSAKELSRLAEKANLTLQVGYMKRHEDNIKALLASKEMKEWGAPLFIRSHSFIGSGWNAGVNTLLPVIQGSATVAADFSEADPGPNWLEAERDSKFYSFDNPFYGLLDTGSHSINLLRYLGRRGIKVQSVKNSGKVRIVDFDMEGIPATMEFCVNFSMRLWDEVTELYFEKATVRVFTPPPLALARAAKVEVYSESGSQDNRLVLEDSKNWAFMNQLRSFVETVKSGRVVNDGDEAVEDVRIIEDIYRKEKGL